MTAALIARARAWCAADPDPGTRAELADLLQRGDRAALAAAFAAPLGFGTAGVRGPLGCGPARMNRLVVRRLTLGLSRWLATAAAGQQVRVVVGRDARHGSAAFAEETIAVLEACGAQVWYLPGPVPTPLLSFAVATLEADAGVQITASHNPAGDNGYKVFGAGGPLLGTAEEAALAAACAQIAEPPALPHPPDPLGARQAVPEEIRAAYRRALLARLGDAPRARLTVAYSALHGVAGAPMLDLLEAAGVGQVVAVAAQQAPDPDFPTVATPNPEQPATLALLAAEADAAGADLALAHDPDGDRLAVLVPDPPAGPRILTGDEIGCLLGAHLLAEAATGPAGGSDLVVATTVVSSRRLARIAAASGAQCRVTPTGFKWLAAALADAARAGARPLFAYEQALGFMCGTTVWDKDGLGAGLALVDLAAALAADDRTLLAALADLDRRHGVHRTAARTVALGRIGGADAVQAILDRVVGGPPGEVAARTLGAVVDYRVQQRWPHTGAVQATGLPPLDLVAWELADGSRALLRPSGTEPILKLYLEVVQPADADPAEATVAAGGRLEVLADTLLATAGIG